MKKKYLFLLGFIALINLSAMAQKPAATKKTEKMNENETMVMITTAMGNIKLKLYNETPGHRDNFIKLVTKGTLDSTIFHRIINGFMIQAGDPSPKALASGAKLSSDYTIPAEIKENLFHKKGALCAARQGDQVNPLKNSSGIQFYIVQGRMYSDNELSGMEGQLGFKFSDEQRKAYTTVGGTPFLDRNYTVFGEVVEGLDVVDKIASVRTVKPYDRPVEDVEFKVTFVK